MSVTVCVRGFIDSMCVPGSTEVRVFIYIYTRNNRNSSFQEKKRKTGRKYSRMFIIVISSVGTRILAVLLTYDLRQGTQSFDSPFLSCKLGQCTYLTEQSGGLNKSMLVKGKHKVPGSLQAMNNSTFLLLCSQKNNERFSLFFTFQEHMKNIVPI